MVIPCEYTDDTYPHLHTFCIQRGRESGKRKREEKLACMKSFNFVPLFQDGFNYSRSLIFSYELWDELVPFLKKKINWDMIGTHFSVDQFGECCYLNSIKCLNP